MENDLRELPTYEGLPNLATFLSEFEGLVTESQRFSALDHVLKATPSRWWETHKKSISEWTHCKRLMEARFSEEVTTVSYKYIELSNHGEHINHCHTAFVE